MIAADSAISFSWYIYNMYLTRKERTLLIGSSIWLLGEGMLGPLFAVFAAEIGGDVLQISWAWATYLIITGIFSMIIGELSDGGDKARVMIFGYALNALFTFGYLFVETPLHLFIVQAGLGLASALATPTWNALYAEEENPKHSGFVWGIADGDFRFVTGIAILLGGAIVNYFSFRALFVTMGTLQIFATIYQIRVLKYQTK